MTLQPKKVGFCSPETGPIKYSELSVSHKGIAPHDDKVKAISELRIPKELTEVCCILGMFNQLKHIFPDIKYYFRRVLLFTGLMTCRRSLTLLRKLSLLPLVLNLLTQVRKPGYTWTPIIYTVQHMYWQLTGEEKEKGEAVQHLIRCNSVTSKPD